MVESIQIRKKREIAEIHLNRSEAHNAFDLEMIEPLTEILLFKK
jgi:enoyl-CoA hydratase/carnithine racemase